MIILRAPLAAKILEEFDWLCFDLGDFEGGSNTMSVPQKSYDEIVDLFARTSSAEVLAFRPSLDSQERVRYLLERNESGDLTQGEAAELERFGELEHLMQLVKARAQVYLENRQWPLPVSRRPCGKRCENGPKDAASIVCYLKHKPFSLTSLITS
jgi:hypothetical protein